jgi:hypothetical protein
MKLFTKGIFALGTLVMITVLALSMPVAGTMYDGTRDLNSHSYQQIFSIKDNGATVDIFLDSSKPYGIDLQNSKESGWMGPLPENLQGLKYDYNVKGHPPYMKDNAWIYPNNHLIWPVRATEKGMHTFTADDFRADGSTVGQFTITFNVR